MTFTNKTIDAIPTDIDSNSLSINQINGLQTYLTDKASAIALNAAKTGMTCGQVIAITANSAKTGISSFQASAITAHTVKVRITTGQASAITSNTSSISTFMSGKLYNNATDTTTGLIHFYNGK